MGILTNVPALNESGNVMFVLMSAIFQYIVASFKYKAARY